jgi:hypothetical protein
MPEYIAATYESEPSVSAHCRDCAWGTMTQPLDNAASHTMWSGHKTFVAAIQTTYFMPEPPEKEKK